MAVLNFTIVVPNCNGSSVVAPWRVRVNGVWREATPGEIVAAQAAFDAAEAQRLQDKADRKALRDDFVAMRAELTTIIDETAWTNVKRDKALKDMAQTMRRMLKVLKDIALP